MQEAVHRRDRLQHRSPHRVEVGHRLRQVGVLHELALQHLDHQEDAVEPPAQIVGQEREVLALRLGCGLELAGLVSGEGDHGLPGSGVDAEVQGNRFARVQRAGELFRDFLEHDLAEQAVFDEHLVDVIALVIARLPVLGRAGDHVLRGAGLV